MIGSASIAPLLASLLTVLLLCAGCDGRGSDQPTRAGEPLARYSATDQSIAFTNLDFTIDSARSALNKVPNDVNVAQVLVSGLLSRLQFRSTFADLDEVIQVAERVRDAEPSNAQAWLLWAEAATAVHRFDDAKEAITKAMALGGDAERIKNRRLSVAIATGEADQVLADLEAQVQADNSYGALTRLASAYQVLDRGVEADGLYAAAFDGYGDVSPFAMAWIFFQRGTLFVDDDPKFAKRLFQEALHYLPSYVPARTDLANLHASLGEYDEAIALFRETSAMTDDPEPLAQLANALIAAGRSEDAKPVVERARAGYESLLAKHPLAFADHAAEFFLNAGNDPQQALALATLNANNRDTARSRELLVMAQKAVDGLTKKHSKG